MKFGFHSGKYALCIKTYAYMHFAIYEVSTGNMAGRERAKGLFHDFNVLWHKADAICFLDNRVKI